MLTYQHLSILYFGGMLGLLLLIFISKIYCYRYKRKLPNGKLYKKHQILNKTEKIMFYQLKQAFPELHIFVQVPFSCIVTPKRIKTPKKHHLFWKINQKRVDFLLCNQNLESLCIIELDGSSHLNRKHFDQERDDFFACSGIPTFRFEVAQLKQLAPAKIRKIISDNVTIN